MLHYYASWAFCSDTVKYMHVGDYEYFHNSYPAKPRFKSSIHHKDQQGWWVIIFSLYYFVLNKENKSYLNLFVHLLVERNLRHQSHYLTKKSHYFGGWLVVKVIIMKIIIIDAKVSRVYFYVVNIFIYLFFSKFNLTLPNALLCGRIVPSMIEHNWELVQTWFLILLWCVVLKSHHVMCKFTWNEDFKFGVKWRDIVIHYT